MPWGKASGFGFRGNGGFRGFGFASGTVPIIPARHILPFFVRDRIKNSAADYNSTPCGVGVVGVVVGVAVVVSVQIKNGVTFYCLEISA